MQLVNLRCYLIFCLILNLNLTQTLEANPLKPTVAERKNSKSKNNYKKKNNVLLISFDSFGWKYLDLVDTPVLNSFKEKGVYADYLINVVPTETFPNHVSLATGLYPETHGIIGNNMYDPEFDDTFNMSVTDPKWWWHKAIEPLWYTNERQGGTSGIIWWPGYNVQNYTPTYWNKNTKLSYKQKVDLALSWIKSDKPPNFLMMYFGMLDHAGHHNGFGSPQTLQEVHNNDNITGYIIKQLKQNNLLDKWNIILTADHGMANTSESKVINVTEYVDTSECMVNGNHFITFVWPKKGMKYKVYQKIKASHHPNMKVWLKENFPKQFHYRDNRRIGPIVLTADIGWTLVIDPTTFHMDFKGSHGYLNTFSLMWPIFFAKGPAFKKGYHSKTFNTVDLYPLMCKLLKINPKPNNGSFSAVEPLLAGSDGNESMSPILVAVIVMSMFFAFGIMICAAAICLSNRKVNKFRNNRGWNNNMVMSELEQSDKLLLNEDGNADEEEEFIAPRSDTL